jgi:transmembrane sensor
MMNNNNTDIWNAIASVLSGKCTAVEKQLIEQWLLENENNPKVYAHLLELGYVGSIEKALLAKERIYDTVQKKIAVHQYKHTLQIWKYIAIATVAMLLVLGSIIISKSGSVIIAKIITKTPNGVRSEITLPDGSIVDLNAGSSLSYPAQFQGKQREVVLNGEAFFRVKKDAKHPFIVKSNLLNMKVLGTSFNVKAYATDERIVTTLLEGSISIEKTISKSKQSGPLVITPNHQVVLDKISGSLKVQEVNASLIVSWKEGQLYFDGENFAEIARKLERNFNVQITIKSEKLKKEVFSGVFDNDESIQQILNMMKKHRNYEYKIIGKKVEIIEN